MTQEELKKLLKRDNEIQVEGFELTDETLVKTAEFVKKAHYGVQDKMGLPYYWHPYRVCELVQERFHSENPLQMNYACVLALLHDVVEDTEYTADDISKELGLNEKESAELKFGLSYVTHDKNKDPYSAYIQKIAECPIIYPVWVKFCDLLDNSSLDRVIITEGVFLTGEDMNRINRYLISIRLLMKRLNSKSNSFKCNLDEVALINNFRTAAERKRMFNEN